MSPTPTSPASVVLEKKTIMVPAVKKEVEDVDDDFGHYDSSSEEEEEESGEEESSEDDEEDSDGSDDEDIDSSSDEEEEAALEAAEAFLKGIQTQKYRRVVSANNLSDLLKMTSGSAMASGSMQHYGPTVVMVDSTPPAKSATQGAFAMCLEEKKKQRRANRRRHSNKGGLVDSQDTTMQDDGSQKSNSSMASSQSMTNLAAFAAAQEEKIMRTNSNSSSSSQDRKNMRRSVSSGTVLQTMSAQMSSSSENDDGAINPVDYLTQLLGGAKPETFAYDSPLLEGFFLGVKPEYVQAWNSDLTHIIRSHDLSALQQLHQQGQRLQACNAFGESIVHLCIRRGTPAMLRFLMQDAGVSVRVCCDYGRTPLHDAAWTLKGEENGKLEMMTLLVQECPMQLLITDKRGFTPLHYVPRNQWQAANDFLDVQAKAGRLPQTKTTRESFKLE